MKGTGLCVYLAAVIFTVIDANGSLKKTACFQPPPPATPSVIQTPIHTKFNLNQLFNRRGSAETDEEPEDEYPRTGTDIPMLGGQTNRPQYIEPDEEDEDEEKTPEVNWNQRWKPAVGFQGKINPNNWGQRWQGEVEDEDGEVEWDRRRRRRRQTAPVISGTVSCDTGKLEKIRIIRVTVGYSHDGVCESRRQRCRRDATSDPQVLLCERDGSCKLSYPQTTFGICPLPVNFVNVEYECLPEDSTYSICNWTDALKNGPVIVTSPGYPGADLANAGKFLTCECVLSAEAGSTISMTSLRTTMSGNMSTCVDDMLLVEKKDPRNLNKFNIVEELCGKNSRENKPLESDVVRLTYLTQVSAAPDKAGFQSVFKATSASSSPSTLRVRCRDLSQGPQDAHAPAVPAPSAGDVPAVRSQPESSANKPKSDPAPAKEKKPVLGTAAGAGAIMGEGPQEGKAAPAEGSTSGMLSAVIASLSSIIAIMGSISIYFLYRRSQRKKMKRFQQQSIRSAGTDVSWYNDPVYMDPSYNQPEKVSQTGQSVKTTEKTLVDSATYTSNQEVDPVTNLKASAPPPPPPPRPTAPPRRGKKRQNDDEGTTVYDNNDVEDVYASISDVYDNA